MTRVALAMLTVVLISGCGTDAGDRGLSGAGIGAGIGIVGGPPGMLVGGAIGAVVGLATPPDQINLGEPVWEDQKKR
jgi:osmotically inducible lipoprotein OsmB